MIEGSHFCDGRGVRFAAEQQREVRSPFSGDTIGRIPMGRQEAVECALSAAAKAFRSWRRTPLEERLAHLDALITKAEAECETLAEMLVSEVVVAKDI